MKRNLFDIGFEDYGQRNGGRPNDYGGWEGVSGLGSATGEPPMPYPLNLKMARDMMNNGALNYEQNFYRNVNQGTVRVGTNAPDAINLIHIRLRILGLRSDPTAPRVFDPVIANQVAQFQAMAGFRELGLPIDGAVDPNTFAMLNFAAWLRKNKKFAAYGSVPQDLGTQQTGRDAAQISAGNIKIASVSDGLDGATSYVGEGEQGSRLPVKDSSPGGSGGTISPACLNRKERMYNTRSRAATRYVSSEAGNKSAAVATASRVDRLRRITGR